MKRNPPKSLPTKLRIKNGIRFDVKTPKTICSIGFGNECACQPPSGIVFAFNLLRRERGKGLFSFQIHLSLRLSHALWIRLSRWCLPHWALLIACENWWSDRGFLIAAARRIRQSERIMLLIFAHFKSPLARVHHFRWRSLQVCTCQRGLVLRPGKKGVFLAKWECATEGSCKSKIHWHQECRWRRHMGRERVF